MQTNIELAGASGRTIRLPVSTRRERVIVAAERPARPATLSAVMSQLKRAEHWETMVWVGLAIAAAALLVMSFAISLFNNNLQQRQEAARWGHRALPPRPAMTEVARGVPTAPSGKKFVADAVNG